jgi:Uma2 family endonuclease
VTQIALPSSPIPLSLEMGAALQLSDDELFELCARNPELRMERTARGDLIVMTPAGGASSHRNLRLGAALLAWADRDGRWVAFDSSTGFLLPNRAMRAPDASCVLRSRLDQVPPQERERFLPLCPDFVIELRSPTDRLADGMAKMEEYRDAGARLGWLIDPVERRVHVYRPDRDLEILDSPERLTGDPELPGFVLELVPIWTPL